MDNGTPHRRLATTLARLALTALVFCLLSLPLWAQDGPNERKYQEGREVWAFQVFCWPVKNFADLLWQRWRLHEFGWGVAVPPLMLNRESTVDRKRLPIARLWIGEDERTWAYSYLKPDGKECLIDIGSDLTFNRPLRKQGQPIAYRSN